MDDFSAIMFGLPLGVIAALIFTGGAPWYYFVFLGAISLIGLLLKIFSTQKEEEE